MDKAFIVFISFYFVPTFAALFSILSFLEGGTGYAYWDYIIYCLVFTLLYALIHCFSHLYPKNTAQYYCSCLYIIALALFHSSMVNFFYWPIVLFIHLMFFTKNDKNYDMGFDLKKPIFITFYKSIPNFNKLLLLATYILVLFFFRFLK